MLKTNVVMDPRIEIIKEKKLAGKRMRMSFADDKTFELWQSFSPRIKEIRNAVNSDLFSVDIYPESNFFVKFDPLKKYEKWAAVEVKDFETIPGGIEKLVIPAGMYAAFPYRGKPSEAKSAFQYIYGTWLPDSDYETDDRPCFALMGEKYKGEHPDSEEEFWIAIRKKTG